MSREDVGRIAVMRSGKPANIDSVMAILKGKGFVCWDGQGREFDGERDDGDALLARQRDVVSCRES